jgi:hypothetical protein
MVRRVLRVAIAASIALALFVLARPARASTAPFCDDRGASAIADAPILQAPDDAIRLARLAPCDGEDRILDASVAPTQRTPIRATTGAEPAVTPRALGLAPPAGDILPAPLVHAVLLPEGVGFRLERPPRG